MLQNYIDQQRLIKAIEGRDGNFIKNAYCYHQEEYIALCKTIVVNKAFIDAQRTSANEYSDKTVDFWRVILYINNIHLTRTLEDSGQSTGLIKLNILPKYYTDIIKSTRDMNNNILEDFTPIWSTRANLVRFQCILMLSIGAVYGLHRANEYFEFKNQAINVVNQTYEHLKYLWSDIPKRNAFLYLVTAASCSVICFKIITSEATKEAMFNFIDWAGSEHKHEHTNHVEVARKRHRDRDVVSLSE